MYKEKRSHRTPAVFDKFWYGAAYYPEHWNAEEVEYDAQRMSDAGFNMVRMAELAWYFFEPVEGKYDFSIFDRAISSFGEKGIKSLLGTPTASAPFWLTAKHPEVLRVNADGVVMEHGSRQHCCYSSLLFRKYSRKITRALAEHYHDNENVVGWQIDNEFFCGFSECHCESCQVDFRNFLREKYNNDISNLNKQWGTAFWAINYGCFDDITTPKSGRPGHCNPTHLVDYYRFLSNQVTVFQAEQIAVLKEINPSWFVTHNGCFQHIDYHGKFSEDLDVMGYDMYPNFCQDPDERPYTQCFNLDRVRAISGNFIIPEHQSGPGGMHPLNCTCEPGELRMISLISISRGCDSLLYFRWRTCRFGTEQYWCGIIDHDNVLRRRYKEVAQLGNELKQLGPELIGTEVDIDCAVAHAETDVIEAHSTLPLGLPSAYDIAEGVHKVFCKRGYNIGCVHPSDDLSRLKLYIIPHWELFLPEWVGSLTEFVKNGGTLVVGARTATRNYKNQVVTETIPGCLRELCGITVEDYGRHIAAEKRALYIDINGNDIPAELWYEVLKTESAKCFYAWNNRFMKGQPAISINKVGKGQVIYVGTYLTEDLVNDLIAPLAELSGIEPLLEDVPADVLVNRRVCEGKALYFIINTTDEPVTVPEVPAGTDLLTGKEISAGALKLSPFGAVVIKEVNKKKQP